MKALLWFVALFAAWIVTAWTLMVGVGVVHAEWLPQLPTIGFGTALLFSTLLTVHAVVKMVFSVIVDLLGAS